VKPVKKFKLHSFVYYCIAAAMVDTLQCAHVKHCQCPCMLDPLLKLEQ